MPENSINAVNDSTIVFLTLFSIFYTPSIRVFPNLTLTSVQSFFWFSDDNDNPVILFIYLKFIVVL